MLAMLIEQFGKNKLLKVYNSAMSKIQVQVLFLIFLSTNAISQTPSFMEGLSASQADALATSVDLSSLTGADSASKASNNGGYMSITQNEYSNVIKQLQSLTREEEEAQFVSELRERKIELAVKLCQQDSNACYLIDQYKQASPSFQKKITDPAELPLFGSNLFSGFPISFNQSEVVSPSTEYIYRIGDEVSFSLFGGQNLASTQMIANEGSIDIQSIGRLMIAGLSISEAQRKFQAFVDDKLIGVEAYLSLKSYRAKQVYSLGNVKKPGLYYLNSTSTSLNGIVAAGGFGDNASLRTIEVLSSNNQRQVIDLYDFLIYGSVTSDIILKNGDRVLVGALENSVRIFGEVNRPALYEITSSDSFQDLLEFALGFSETANKKLISVKRKNGYGQYIVLNFKSDDNFDLQHGDIIEVTKSSGELTGFVSLNGAIRNPGNYQFTTNLNLADILDVSHDLTEDTYMPFALVKRFNINTRSWQYKIIDLLSPERLASFKLKARDNIYIFSSEDVAFINSLSMSEYIAGLNNGEGRASSIINYSDQLTSSLSPTEIDTNSMSGMMQSERDISNRKCLEALSAYGDRDFLKAATIKVSLTPAIRMQCTSMLANNPQLTPLLLDNAIPVFGKVIKPGLYPTSTFASAKDIVALAGGLAHKGNAKHRVDVGSYSTGQDGLESTNLKYISIVTNQPSNDNAYIDLVGEFEFPGRYKLEDGTRLVDIYKRAGGIKSSGFPLGGILTRESVKEKEILALKRAEEELSDILASAVVSGVLTQSTSDVVALMSLMTNVKNTEPTGRLISELNPIKIERGDLSLNIILKPGDTIYIPKPSNTITIVGSVLNPVSVPYNPSLSFKDYIQLAGGFKEYADEEKGYIILPNGKSTKPKKNLSLFRANNIILPGSTIIIPRDARPLTGFTLVEAITPVLANLSITAASIASINK
jgi:polysaccharide biosynthesis/export protein